MKLPRSCFFLLSPFIHSGSPDSCQRHLTKSLNSNALSENISHVLAPLLLPSHAFFHSHLDCKLPIPVQKCLGRAHHGRGKQWQTSGTWRNKASREKGAEPSHSSHSHNVCSVNHLHRPPRWNHCLWSGLLHRETLHSVRVATLCCFRGENYPALALRARRGERSWGSRSLPLPLLPLPHRGKYLKNTPSFAQHSETAYSWAPFTSKLNSVLIYSHAVTSWRSLLCCLLLQSQRLMSI